jgi:outer membrane protein assembly factor BamA
MSQTCRLSQYAIFVLFVSACAAQPAEYLGRPIRGVEFTHPNILHPDDLKRLDLLKPGDTLTSDDAAESIDRLFATGMFEDIAIEAFPSGNGVTVRFVTEPARFVSGYVVEGKLDQPPNRGEITSTSQLQLGSKFRQDDVTAAVDRINGLFHSNGLYEAKVAPEVKMDSPAQQVFVTFNINSGKRAKYEMPVIHGETKLSESTILRATGWRVPLIHWWRHVTALRTRNGVQGILGKYQKDKRLTTTVELEKVDYDAKRRRVQPVVDVHPGPKIEVKAIEAKVSNKVLKRYVPVYEERSVDNDLLVEGARNLRDYFQSRGYYDVDVTFRMQPVVNDEQAIEYVVSPVQPENFRQQVFQRRSDSRTYVHDASRVPVTRPLQRSLSQEG